MDERGSAMNIAKLLLHAKSTMQNSLRHVNESLDVLKQYNSQETVQDRFRILSRDIRHMPEIQRIEQAACSSTAQSSTHDDLDDKYLADSIENRRRISAYYMENLRQFFAQESYNVQSESQEVRSGAESASQDQQSAVEDHIQKPKKRGRRKKKSRSAVQNVDEHTGKDLKSGSEMSKQKHVRTNQEEFNADNDQNKCYAFEENIKQKRQENESQVESNADESQTKESTPEQKLDKMQQGRNIRQNLFTTDESQTEESPPQQKSDKIKKGRNSITLDKCIADEKFKNEKSFKQKEKESFEDEPIALEVESQVEQNESDCNIKKPKKSQITENATQSKQSAVEVRIQKPKKRGRSKRKSHTVLQNVDEFNHKDLKSAFEMAKLKHVKTNQEVLNAEQNESCVFEKNRKQENGSLVKSSANEYQAGKYENSDKRQQGRNNITQNKSVADDAQTEGSSPQQKSDKIKRGKNSITQDKYIADKKFENEKSVELNEKGSENESAADKEYSNEESSENHLSRKWQNHETLNTSGLDENLTFNKAVIQYDTVSNDDIFGQGIFPIQQDFPKTTKLSITLIDILKDSNAVNDPDVNKFLKKLKSTDVVAEENDAVEKIIGDILQSDKSPDKGISSEIESCNDSRKDHLSRENSPEIFPDSKSSVLNEPSSLVEDEIENHNLFVDKDNFDFNPEELILSDIELPAEIIAQFNQDLADQGIYVAEADSDKSGSEKLLSSLMPLDGDSNDTDTLTDVLAATIGDIWPPFFEPPQT